ncbi:hypothetical protein LTR35_018081 [Friedmanniomyces endolithicus]|nr:hypothetical protein LTR35_018081 [Friedmanniomyces endolithicus]KAK0265307.1 hypothetical protein LTS00_017997 [Friedmanniomyces endolithicus]
MTGLNDIAHTYACYLLPQPDVFTLPSWDAGRGYNPVSVYARMNFSVDAMFVEVGAPIAANYFRAQNPNNTATALSKHAAIPSLPTNDTIQLVPINSNDLELGAADSNDAFTGVANIVVPAHVLELFVGRHAWDPDPERQRQVSKNRTDSRRSFDAASIARDQHAAVERIHARASSIAIGALARSRDVGDDSRANPFTVAGPRELLRKTSLPTLREQASSATLGSSSTQGSSVAARSSWHTSKSRKTHGKRPDSDIYNALMTFPGELSGDSILFQKLSGYDLNRANKNRIFDEKSPFDCSNYIIGDSPFEDPAYVVPNEKTESIYGTGIGPLKSRMSIGLERRGTVLSRIRRNSVLHATTEAITNVTDTAVAGLADAARRTSLANLYEQDKTKGQTFQRKEWAQTVFEYTIYLILILFIYFVLVGVPLWKGAVWWLYWVVGNVSTEYDEGEVCRSRNMVDHDWLGSLYAYAPLFMLFEKEPPMPRDLNAIDATKTPGVHNTALLIPCYKSTKIIGPTLVAALKIFPPDHIYVIANGNSPTPLDDTEEVCGPYGVNHIWCPVGGKIVAQFVGFYAAKHFENVLLIDDDCALPANFPIVSDRMKGKIQCVGYTIKSVGPNSSRGTFCQQAQDLEYKNSGLQRQLAGVIGSATFPHGAISLWNTRFLIQTFHTHPGFSVSEDWFFGHVARELGCRIIMCSAIFVETETPTDVFFAARGGSRGGFGEMTVFKQRFYRWNFFFVNGMYYNLKYIVASWKLGFWEIGAKLFIWQEVYETLLCLLAPFMLLISLIVRPAFCGYLTVGTFMLYYVNVTIFNEIHLRLRNERIAWMTLYVYYAPYKIALTCINIVSCYWALYKYARYFAKKHPKVIEDEKAVEVVFRLEEDNQHHSRHGRRPTAAG